MDLLWLLVPLAYAAGTFPSAPLVGRVVGHDPTREGSRNPGASNMYRIAGRNAGVIVLLADVIKGLVPTLFALLVSGRPIAAACGVAAVLGHIFPATRGFQGGKGVATYGGMTVVLWPWVGAVALAVWLLALRLGGKASIGALVAMPLIAGLVVLAGRPGWEVVVAVAMAGLIIIRHRENISRLVRGEEGAVTT